MQYALQLALASVLVLFAAQQRVQASIITISGTGQFDQSLGTLNSVTVVFDPPSVASTDSGSHAHSINPSAFAVPLADGTVVDFFPITLSLSHQHIFDIPTFSWNGLLVDVPAVTTTTSVAAESINFAPTTVAGGKLDLPPTTFTGSQHNHVIDVPQFSQTFTGSDLNVFLTGSPTSTVDPPAVSTSISGSHSIALVAGNYRAFVNGVRSEVTITSNTSSSTDGNHIHVINIPSFGVTSTTFDYTPTPPEPPAPVVPEPSTFITLTGLIACIGLVGWWKRSKATQSQ